MDPASSAAATLLLFGVLGPGAANAQVTPVTRPTQTAVSKPVAGAYGQLAPRDQQIALALYTAQPRTAAGRRLPLDQIAAMKQRGQRWTQIFDTMKGRGLVHDDSLAQLVAKATQRSYPTSAGTAVSASPKVYPKSRPERSLGADEGASASLGSTDSGNNH